MRKCALSRRDDSVDAVLANIADWVCLGLRFSAVEARHERQTAVWQHLVPS